MNANYYLDTSALVKAYVQEAGSSWTQQLIVSTSPARLYVSLLVRVEMASAIARRLRTGSVSSADAQRILQEFTSDWSWRYTVLSVSPVVIERAYKLAQTFVLRGYDAVHLASALVIHDTLIALGETGITFLSADHALLQAAQQEGLNTDNPLNYP